MSTFGLVWSHRPYDEQHAHYNTHTATQTLTKQPAIHSRTYTQTHTNDRVGHYPLCLHTDKPNAPTVWLWCLHMHKREETRKHQSRRQPVCAGLETTGFSVFRLCAQRRAHTSHTYTLHTWSTHSKTTIKKKRKKKTRIKNKQSSCRLRWHISMWRLSSYPTKLKSRQWGRRMLWLS